MHIWENTKQILVLMKNISNTWNPSLQTQAMLVNNGVWECMLFREWRFISFSECLLLLIYYRSHTNELSAFYSSSVSMNSLIQIGCLYHRQEYCSQYKQALFKLKRKKIELSFTSSLTEVENVKVHEKIKRNLTSLWSQWKEDYWCNCCISKPYNME